MNKAIKYRIYPTEQQRELFIRTFGCCRKVYNLMLQDKIRSYTEHASFGMQTPAMYKKDYPYLREVDSLALANVQLNLQRAMKNCFDRSRKNKMGFQNSSPQSVVESHTPRTISMDLLLLQAML